MFHQREVQALIDDRFGGRASEVTRLSGGDWSQAYALSLDGTQVVARFGIHGEDYEKDRIASGWASDELPIPKVLELDETKVGFFALSSRARGEFLDELRSEQIRGVLPSLFSTMDAIHAIDVSATEGYGNWTSDGHGPQRTWREALLHKFADDRPSNRTHGWRAALEGSPRGTRDFDAALKALERLTERMPTERHVIHNDLLNHNVLVQGDRISAVLDWATLCTVTTCTTRPGSCTASHGIRHGQDWIWPANCDGTGKPMVHCRTILRRDCSAIRSMLGSMRSRTPPIRGTGIS